MLSCWCWLYLLSGLLLVQLLTIALSVLGPIALSVLVALGVLDSICSARGKSGSRQQLPTIAFCVGGPRLFSVAVISVGCLPVGKASGFVIPGNNYVLSTVAFCVGGFNVYVFRFMRMAPRCQPTMLVGSAFVNVSKIMGDPMVTFGH